ncbi:MAG: metallophosphoesterase [Anaerofustis sp.]
MVYWIIAGILIIALAAEFIRSYVSVGITRQSYQNKKIPQAFHGYRILVLSDLHGKSFGSGNHRLTEKIIPLQPDLIVMAGDMIDKHQTNLRSFFALTDALVGICPVVFALGNHEIRLPKNVMEELKHGLSERGVHWLDNAKQTMIGENGQIELYGLTVDLNQYKGLNRTFDQSAVLDAEGIRGRLGAPNEEAFRMLIAHLPTLFEAYAEWGADLVIGGHMHGGLVRLPFIGGVLSPEIRFFPKYDAGVFHSGESTMFVSRGLGNGKWKFRFFNSGEILLIELQSIVEV